ncbi:MAG: diphthine--ammonia ligase [Vicingaceae bacterium]|nr:diphthine--ammonia ligase [Vicingaceae bacterium]
MEKEPIVMSWSGGKDASFALYKILQEGKYDVKYLLTNIYEPNKRVSMHGVPEELIEAQAKSIGIPLKTMYIKESSHKEYNIKMNEMLLSFKAEGIFKVAFGDIFLDDLKQYREDKLAEVEMTGVFPLWKRNTRELAKEFIQIGFRSHICSIDASKIPSNLVGVDFTYEFLNELPNEVDYCGENGEFHSYCYNGPIFNKRICFQINGVSEQKYEYNVLISTYLFSDISLSY